MLVGGDWNHGTFYDFPITLGISSSQLTNSIISEGLFYHQPDKVICSVVKFWSIDSLMHLLCWWWCCWWWWWTYRYICNMYMLWFWLWWCSESYEYQVTPCDMSQLAGEHRRFREGPCAFRESATYLNSPLPLILNTLRNHGLVKGYRGVWY